MIRRQFFIFVCSMLALSGAVVGTLASVQHRNTNLNGYVDPTRTQDLPFRLPRLGVNADLTQYSQDELSTHLELMRRANIFWVRQIFDWENIEPSAGNFQWGKWDDIVATVDLQSDLEMVAVLTRSPSWSRVDRNADSTAPPDVPDTFAQFAKAFAARYGDYIDYYQIWDEPNIEIGWGGKPPRTADYAALLQAGYRAIHSTDPDAVVIAAALAPTIETGPQNISDIIYLRELYTLGLREFSDGVAAKPYGFNDSPNDRRVSRNHLNFSRIVALREVMTDYGDGQTALWASSWGWNNLPNDWSGSPSIWGSVSSAEQAQYTVDALARAEREWPWIGGMILQHWQPDAAANDPSWGFAVIDSNNHPRPIWSAMSEYTVPPGASNGLYAARNPYASYSGIWTFSDFGADIGWVEDSAVTFDFYGSDIALLLRKGNYVAYFYPEIVGGTVSDLPHDAAGNPYIVLTSETLETQVSLISIARGLPQQPYQLHIKAHELVPDELVNRWTLVGYAVSSGDLAVPYNRQIAVGIVSVCAAALAVLVSALQLDWNGVKLIFSPAWSLLGNTGQILLGVFTSLLVTIGMYLTWKEEAPALFRKESVQIVLSLLTSGIIYINTPNLVVTVAAGILLFVVIYNRLELGLMLTILWAPFFLFPVELYRYAFPMVEIVVLITTAAWLIRRLAAYRIQATHRTSWSAMDYLILTWVVLGCISLVWVDHRSVALTELRTLVIQPALFYAVLRSQKVGRKVVLQLADTLLVAGFLVSVIGLFLWFRNENVVTAEAGVRRLASVYGSPNNVGLLLGRCLPFLLAYLFLPTGRTRHVFATVLLLGIFPALILTQSAGTLFVGVPVAIGMVVILSFRHRAILPLLVICAVTLGGGIFAVQSPRFSRILTLSEGTNFYRVRVWDSALQMIADYPVTGVGLDQFLYKFRGKYILPDAWREPNLSHPHNFVLDVWLRLGMGGFVIFAIMQVIFWQSAIRMYTYFYSSSNYLSLALMIGSIGSMGVVLAHGLVDNSVFVLDLAYIFMFLLALPSMMQNTRAIDENH